MCATLGVPGTVSRACKSGGGVGGETLRENTWGAIPRKSSWMHRAQIVDWSGEITKNFRKQRRHLASRVPGGEVETIQVDCDSPGLGEWNYYSKSWNTQLMKAKFTLSAQDFLFKYTKTDFICKCF